MSTPLPEFDPYAVLGVDSKATVSEIKTAYRKLALKCHPDKIHDDDLKAKAVVEFQKVQESYEILTDDTRRQKYDQNVYLNSLRKDLAAQQASYNREYRDGRMYEERVPADAAFFTGSDEMLYADEPASYSPPKYYDSPKRSHTKAAEEKRKPKSATAYTYSTSRPTTSSNTKTSDREHAKATHYASAKSRTKERRRDASEKYERSGHLSDSDYSDREFEPKSKPKSQSYSQSYSQPYSQSYSQPQPPPAPAPPPPRYTKTKIEVETRYPRESAPPRRKAETLPTYIHHDYYDLPPERAPSPPRRAPSPPRRKPEVVPMAASYEDIEYSSTDESFVAGREGDFDNHRKSKVDSQQVWAKEYMFIKKDQPPTRPPTDWPDEFEKPERRHSESARHSSPRTTHTFKETVTSEAPPRTSHRSHEDLGSPERGHSSKYEYDRKVDRGHERGRTVPSLSTTTSQKVSSSSNRPPPIITRSATAPYPPRTRREGVVRSESKGPFSTLMSMVTGLPSDAKVSSSRTSTTRATSRARGVSRPRGTERNDSGYSSGPSTPEMPQGVSSKTKYKNYDTIEREPKEVYVSTSYESVPSSRSERTRDRSEARPKHSRKTTTTYTYPSKDKEPEIVTRRPAAVSSKISTSPSSSYSDRTLYREIPSDFVRDGGHRYHRQKGQTAY